MKTSPGCERDLQPLHALDHRLHRELHRADEHRQAELALRDQLAAVAVVDAVGAVERLGDHRAEGAADEREVHLVADLHQAVLQDRERDGVERLMALILVPCQTADDEVADRIDLDPVARLDHGRAIELLDDRRPAKLASSGSRSRT